MSLIAEYRHHCATAAKFRRKLTNCEVHMPFNGIDLVIRGDYTPSERPSTYYPGCSEDFDVTEVYLADSAIDVTKLFDCDELAVAVLSHFSDEEQAA